MSITFTQNSCGCHCGCLIPVPRGGQPCASCVGGFHLQDRGTKLIVTQGGVPVADQAQGIADFREACRTASPQEAAQMQQNEFLVSQLQERIRNYERSRQAAQNVFDHQKVLSIVSRALRMADATEVMMVIVRKWIDTKYLSAEEFEAFKKAAKAVEEASECTQ